ncbi:DNA glycosylase [Apiospora arundinis]
MMDSEQVVDEAPAATAPPSFKGRLRLHEFMYKTTSTKNTSIKSPSPVRRSPRGLSVTPSPSKAMVLSPSKSQSPAPSSSSVSSRKRKLPPATETSLTSSFFVKQEDTEEEEEEEGGDSKTAISSAPSRTPSPKKRTRGPNGYAPPSTYAHLSPLVDILAPDLLVLFIGLNPGLQTARSGHAYAHPSNLFWKLLYSSRITPVPCRPDEDRTLPARYGLGNTNIVSRPSRNGAELSKAEMDEGVAVLEAKIRAFRPEVACIVGKGIWESVWRVRHGRNLRKADGFAYGWQDESENMGVIKPGSEDDDVGNNNGDGFKGARVFVATSTSGLAASMRPAEKEAVWRELGVWCTARRKERGMKEE